MPSASDGINSKMYFTSSTDFRNLELGGTKTFTFDNAGTVTPDTRKLLAGMYLVQVTINGKTTTRKIIKQ